MTKNFSHSISEKFVGYLLASVLWLLAFHSASLSQTLEQNPSAPDGEFVCPLVPDLPEQLPADAKAQVFQYDSSALGNRIPLMLIHGGGGESRPYFRMDGIAKWLQHDTRFQQKFKIYFLRYNGSTVLDESVPKIQDGLIDFHNKVHRAMVVVAYSLGGNAMVRALLDPEVDNAVALVVTLGTPFRGSPLFCCDWYEYSLHRNHFNLWSRLFKTHSRRVYFKRNAHFISDLRWDNADGHVPEVGSFRCVTPFGPRGNLTVDGTANDKLSTINTKAAHTRQKFIAYAGYLTNPFMLKRALQPPVLFFQTPIYFLGTKFPIFLGQEHAALRMLNRDISRVRVNPEGHSGSATSMPYLLNDGLVPVTSCLLLTPNAFEAFPAPRESDLPKLNSYLDVRLARVFRNVDHVSFADAKAPHLGSSHLEDAMHPDEKQRALLDWLLLDLLEASAQHNH